MTQDLQQLLDTIRRDGVEKARAEAADIVAEAKKKAADIVAEGERQAQAAREAARRDADTFAQRSSDAVRQAARDLMLGVEREITELLTQVLATDVKTALADPARLATLAEQAVRAYLAGGDSAVQVLVSAGSAEAIEILRGRLAGIAAGKEGLTVALDTSGAASATGFRIRLDGGRIAHDFTAGAIAEAIGRHVRPQLAALLRD